MKVAFIHTDLRLYWHSRLIALNRCLRVAAIELHIFEIAGKGSPYEFSSSSIDESLNWNILFPETRMEDLPSGRVSRVLRKVLDNLMPDIVIAGPIAFQSGAISINWANKNKKPTIIFDDIRLIDVPRSWLVNKIKKLIFANVDAMIVPEKSEWYETYHFFGLKENQIFDGIDVIDNSFFTSDKRESSNLLDPTLSIIAIGRQVAKKNWITLLQAWIIINTNKPNLDFRLLFIGDGPEHKKLVEMTARGQCSNVTFLPFQTQEAVKEIYNSAAAVILPSLHSETWGLVINEAMASGLPVLVSEQCGCASTLVKHGQNGYIFDPANIDDISNVLDLFMSLNAEEREAMGKVSLEIIKDWDLDRFCKGMKNAIDFVNITEKKSNYLGKIISRFWKGRYRPV